MGRCDVQPPDEQALVCDPVEQFPGGIHDLLRGRGVAFQIDCAVGVFRYLPPVVILHDCAAILPPAFRVGQVLNVIANRDNELVGDKAFVNQVHREKVCHFPENEPRFVCLIRLVQHLSRSQAVAFRLVRLDCLHCARLPAPSMINQQLRILAEELVKQILIRDGAAGDIAHREHPVLFKLLGISFAYPPEVGEGLV